MQRVAFSSGSSRVQATFTNALLPCRNDRSEFSRFAGVSLQSRPPSFERNTETAVADSSSLLSTSAKHSKAEHSDGRTAPLAALSAGESLQSVKLRGISTPRVIPLPIEAVLPRGHTHTKIHQPSPVRSPLRRRLPLSRPHLRPPQIPQRHRPPQKRHRPPRPKQDGIRFRMHIPHQEPSRL